jgi:hypothetical protein
MFPSLGISWTKQPACKKQDVRFLLATCLVHFLPPRIEAVYYPELSGNSCPITRCYNPANSTLHGYCCENLKLKKTTTSCRIWGSHKGSYDVCHLLWYSALWTDISEEHITFIFRVENQLSKKPLCNRWLHSHMSHTVLYPRRWQHLYYQLATKCNSCNLCRKMRIFFPSISIL